MQHFSLEFQIMNFPAPTHSLSLLNLTPRGPISQYNPVPLASAEWDYYWGRRSKAHSTGQQSNVDRLAHYSSSQICWGYSLGTKPVGSLWAMGRYFPLMKKIGRNVPSFLYAVAMSPLLPWIKNSIGVSGSCSKQVALSHSTFINDGSPSIDNQLHPKVL